MSTDRMTTQPSDWAVARALELSMQSLKGPSVRAYDWVMMRARELDASGGGSEPVAWANPADINCLGFEDGNSYPGIRRHADELHTSPLYATPRAAEAATTNSAQISSSLVVGDWLPIESAPEDIGLCVVYTPDHGDGERFDIDWKEDGVWQEHYNHYEHFMAVGGVNACGPDVVCTGPDERPEYTHYRPLKAPQAAMGAVGAGGGEHG